MFLSELELPPSILPNTGRRAKLTLPLAGLRRYTPAWNGGRSFSSDIKDLAIKGLQPLRNPLHDLFGAPMLSLREVVDRYLATAGKFGEPVALSAFHLNPADTRSLFNVLDEDYHLSRFLHFSHAEGDCYIISGARVTHVSIDSGIQSML